MMRPAVGFTVTLAALAIGIAFVSWCAYRTRAAPQTAAGGSPGSGSGPVGHSASSSTQLAARPLPASFPTRPGSYVADGWRYDYSVTAPGSRSERRTGHLYQGGREITGALGEIRDTPMGRFGFFGSGSQRYNVGWLNTLTYDQPVFDSDGQVLPTVQRCFTNPAGAAGRGP